MIRSLEQKRQGFREGIGAGHANPSIFEWLTETEEHLAALRAEAESDAGIGSRYRRTSPLSTARMSMISGARYPRQPLSAALRRNCTG